MLSRLLEQGWIEQIESNIVSESKRIRKEYQLSALGSAILKAEVGRLKQFIAVTSGATGGR